MRNAIVTVIMVVFAAAATVLAAAPSPADAHGLTAEAMPRGAEPTETVTPVFNRELPNVPGKQILAVEVSYPPGAASPPHRHPKSAFIYAYVLSGEIESVVDDEEPRVYRAGESWHETPGAHHRVSRNASTTKPAKLLAIFVADSTETQLVFPDAK